MIAPVVLFLVPLPTRCCGPAQRSPPGDLQRSSCRAEAGR